MHLTTHATIRMLQRAIDGDILRWLDCYGRRVHDGRHAVVVHFDRQARSRLRQHL